jgi:hypothetical protein
MDDRWESAVSATHPFAASRLKKDLIPQPTFAMNVQKERSNHRLPAALVLYHRCHSPRENLVCCFDLVFSEGLGALDQLVIEPNHSMRPEKGILEEQGWNPGGRRMVCCVGCPRNQGSKECMLTPLASDKTRFESSWR